MAHIKFANQIGPSGRKIITLGVKPPAKLQPQSERDRGEAVAECLRQWRKIYPAIFAALPLAIGSGEQLRAQAIAAGYSNKVIKTALRRHCSRQFYLCAIAADGSKRHNLDGDPIEMVSDNDRKHAAARIAEIRAKADE